jgi:hypothetical protein
MLFVFLAAVLLFMDCSSRRNRFQPTDYFPIRAGYTWIFNGEIHKMEITDITKEVGDKIITFSYFDSLDVPLWQEKYNYIKNQIFLQSFEPMTQLLPRVSFEPPLPFAPISQKVGQNLPYPCFETQVLDSLVTTTKLEIDYLIEAVEDVRVPAGHFLNCIKMKINVKYPQNTKRPYFNGDQYWWFAPRVGPIKYDLPTASGELIEMPDIKPWQPDISIN